MAPSGILTSVPHVKMGQCAPATPFLHWPVLPKNSRASYFLCVHSFLSIFDFLKLSNELHIDLSPILELFQCTFTL